MGASTSTKTTPQDEFPRGMACHWGDSWHPGKGSRGEARAALGANGEGEHSFVGTSCRQGGSSSDSSQSGRVDENKMVLAWLENARTQEALSVKRRLLSSLGEALEAITVKRANACLETHL